MSLRGIAKETLEVIERGTYAAPTGENVDISRQVRAAMDGTALYRPDDFPSLWPKIVPRSVTPRIDVTTETTAAAGRRLVTSEGVNRVVALNFASAKNPGGGFIGGAKAQEEDLARCSALFACLLTQREYYNANRAFPSLLYTDHMIYSPDVPFFRDERLDFLATPFALSIITAPAPNAGEALARDADIGPRLRQTLNERALKLLAVAAAHEHRTLVLGAWGCGVFRNDAGDVAQAFAGALGDERLRGAFDRVVFAVYDRGGGRNLAAFEKEFGRAQLL
jgi:uncharacterized protein (TIGR02452 family)